MLSDGMRPGPFAEHFKISKQNLMQNWRTIILVKLTSQGAKKVPLSSKQMCEHRQSGSLVRATECSLYLNNLWWQSTAEDLTLSINWHKSHSASCQLVGVVSVTQFAVRWGFLLHIPPVWGQEISVKLCEKPWCFNKTFNKGETCVSGHRVDI